MPRTLALRQWYLEDLILRGLSGATAVSISVAGIGLVNGHPLSPEQFIPVAANIASLPAAGTMNRLVAVTSPFSLWIDNGTNFLPIFSPGSTTVNTSAQSAVVSVSAQTTTYRTVIEVPWNTWCYVTGKTTSQFTVNFSTVAPGTSTFYWEIKG